MPEEIVVNEFQEVCVKGAFARAILSGLGNHWPIVKSWGCGIPKKPPTSLPYIYGCSGKNQEKYLQVRRTSYLLVLQSLSGEPDYFGRNKISSGGDLSHYSSASLY